MDSSFFCGSVAPMGANGGKGDQQQRKGDLLTVSKMQVLTNVLKYDII